MPMVMPEDSPGHLPGWSYPSELLISSIDFWDSGRPPESSAEVEVEDSRVTPAPPDSEGRWLELRSGASEGRWLELGSCLKLEPPLLGWLPAQPPTCLPGLPRPPEKPRNDS